MYKLDIYSERGGKDMHPVFSETKASEWFSLVSSETISEAIDLFRACLFAKNQLRLRLGEKNKLRS